MKHGIFFSVLILAVLAFGVSGAAPAWARKAAHHTEAAVTAPAPTAEHIAPSPSAEPAAAEAEQKENLGFPQLNAKTYASQVFWLFVAFILLYALMSTLALPRVTEVLDARRLLKDNNLGDAAKLNGEAEKIKTDYERALAKAQRSARKRDYRPNAPSATKHRRSSRALLKVPASGWL